MTSEFLIASLNYAVFSLEFSNDLHSKIQESGCQQTYPLSIYTRHMPKPTCSAGTSCEQNLLQWV